MKLTIKLLRKTMLFLFICFLIQEVISMICILIFFVFLLDDNKRYVDNTSLTHILEISNSFNTIIERQLSSIQSDLYLIYSHASVFKEDSPEITKTSPFYLSFNNPKLILNTDFEHSDVYKTYENTDAIQPGAFLLLKHLKNKYELAKPYDQSKHIDNLFKEIGLKTASFYTKASSIPVEHNMAVNYIISILNAITIRDLNLNKLPNEYSLISEEFFYLYPPNIIEFDKGLNYLFYDTTSSSCPQKYQPNCITGFMSNQPMNGKAYINTVYFNHPKLESNETIGQACINMPFILDPSTFQSVLCSKFQFKKIEFHLPLLNHVMDFSLISIKETNQGKDIELLYLIDTIYNLIQPSFSNNKFKRYAFNSTQSTFSLFHLLYYHMFQYLDPELKEDFIDQMIQEYENNLQLILPTLTKYLNEIKGREKIGKKTFQFNVTQTYITYFRSQNGTLFHKENDYYKDTFYLSISPIIIDTSNEKANTNRFIYFSFIVNRNEIAVKENDLYHLLAIKAVNFFIFGILLLLFVISIFHFSVELYVNYLLSPITQFKEDLLMIVNNIPAYLKWTSRICGNNNQNKLKQNDLNTIGSFNWENNSDICQYQNSDTKNVEYAIVFLKKILLMKYYNNIKYEEKANIYKESLVYLQKYPLEYIRCSFIVAINLFKLKKYQQSIDKLNEICFKIKSQIAQISINEDVKLSSNLFTEYKCYINEFSNLSSYLSPPAKKSFELNMMFQNCFFIIGLVDWLWFKELKKINRRKDSNNDNLELNKKRDNNQMDYFLIEKAILSFSNALEINNLMKSNSIKNIWIYLLLSKCEYEKGQYQKSNCHLQESFVELMDFNNYLINSKIGINEKTIILINGLLLQYILYQLGKLMTKMKKYKTACEVLILCIEISLFKIEKIQSNCFVKIGKLFKEKLNNEANIIKKIAYRLNPDLCNVHNKTIIILTTVEFVNDYDLIEELKDALIKYIPKLFYNDTDYIGYIEVGVNQMKCINLNFIASFCEEFRRKYEANQILTSENSIHTQFCSEGNNPSHSHSRSNSSKEKTTIDNNSEYSHSLLIYQGMIRSIATLNEFNSKIPQDKYIFIFGMSKFIDFCENEQWTNVRNILHQDNISLYVFCFENEIPEPQKSNIIKYLKKGNMIEGLLFEVSSFKLIKKAFQNITTKGKKRVLKVSYNDINNIY